jgi:hypothetical protein
VLNDDFTVCNRIHRAAASESDIGEFRTELQRLDQMEECFLVHARSLANEPIVLLILEGTVMPVQQDRKAPSMWLPVCRVMSPLALRKLAASSTHLFTLMSLLGPRPDPLPRGAPRETRSPASPGRYVQA